MGDDPRVGRPRKSALGVGKVFSVRLTPELHAQLMATAKRTGLTATQIAETGIRKELKRLGRHVTRENAP